MTLRWKIAQALEIRWWQRYLKHRETSTYLAAKRAYWQKLLRELPIELRPGVRILDAGCGPAGIFMILESYAVDAIDPLLDLYEKKLPHFNKNDYAFVQFYNKPLENFEILSNYDVVFCMNAINHMADLARSLDQLAAATATGGQLVVATDAHKNCVLKAIFRMLPGDLLHPHQHDEQDYCRMLEARHCKIKTVKRLKTGQVFDYIAIIAEKVSEQ